MIKINLIPPEILAEQAKKQQIIQVGAAGVVLAALVACLSAWHWNTKHGLTSHRDEIKAELNKVNEKVKEVEKFQAQKAAVEARLKVITDLLKGRLTYPAFLEDFARAVTGGIWITGMNTSDAAGGLKVQVQARALGKDKIADWIRELEKYGVTVDTAAPAPEPLKGPGAKKPEVKDMHRFKDIELGGIQAAMEEGTQIFSFTLTCVYKNPKL